MTDITRETPCRTAAAAFGDWIKACTTMAQLQEAADSVNRLVHLVRAQQAEIQAEAKAAFKGHARVGARVLFPPSRDSERAPGTIVKTTPKYAHVLPDDAPTDSATFRVSFTQIELLPESDPRFPEAVREQARAEAKQRHALAVEKAAEWRKGKVRFLGDFTDEQRTALEARLDQDLATRP